MLRVIRGERTTPHLLLNVLILAVTVLKGHFIFSERHSTRALLPRSPRCKVANIYEQLLQMTHTYIGRVSFAAGHIIGYISASIYHLQKPALLELTEIFFTIITGITASVSQVVFEFRTRRKYCSENYDKTFLILDRTASQSKLLHICLNKMQFDFLLQNYSNCLNVFFIK